MGTTPRPRHPVFAADVRVTERERRQLRKCPLAMDLEAAVTDRLLQRVQHLRPTLHLRIPTDQVRPPLTYPVPDRARVDLRLRVRRPRPFPHERLNPLRHRESK